MAIGDWFMVSRGPLSFVQYAKFYACFDWSLSYKLLCTRGQIHKIMMSLLTFSLPHRMKQTNRIYVAVHINEMKV